MKYSSSSLLILYTLILLTYSLTKGYYRFEAVAALSICFFLTFIYSIKPHLFPINPLNIKFISVTVLLISIILSYFFYGGIYQEKSILYNLSKYLLLIASFAALTSYFKIKNTKFPLEKIRFLLLFFISILMQIFMVVSSPNPGIDLYYPLKEAPKMILRGENPYSASFQAVQNLEPNIFFYFPITIFVFLPINLILDDPRYTIIFANIVSAIILFKLANKSKNGKLKYITPLIFLYHPFMSLIIEQAWTDFVVVSAFYCFIYFSVIKANKAIISVFLAAIIGIKQYYLLILPLAVIFKKIHRNIIAASILLVLLSILPFLLLSQKEFINDTISYHLKFSTLRHDGLTLNSLIYSELGFNIPRFLALTIISAFYLYFFKKGIKNLSAFILATTITMFAFFLINHQAYINYYIFVTSLLLLASITNLTQTKKEHS